MATSCSKKTDLYIGRDGFTLIRLTDPNIDFKAYLYLS